MCRGCSRESGNSTFFLSDLNIPHRERFWGQGETSTLAKQKNQVICLFVLGYFGDTEVYIINIYYLATE